MPLISFGFFSRFLFLLNKALSQHMYTNFGISAVITEYLHFITWRMEVKNATERAVYLCKIEIII